MGTKAPAAGTGQQRYTATFGQVGDADVALVGGKGARLGELSRIDGVSVPPGFCVTTAAFRVAEAADPTFAAPIPQDIADAITAALAEVLGPDGIAGDVPVAVRSSATAEDLAGASFAGQHDSFLNVRGAGAVLDHVRKVWVSLFTDRAVAYRARTGISEDDVQMAVVVQRMARPAASGVLFTADPISGNRLVSSIDAVAGLGEALVSGLVTPDTYRVRGEAVIERALQQSAPVLSDAQAIELAALGRKLEAHFGAPQDVEWCRSDDGFAVVQSRPITHLYPLPAGADDGAPHVYVSVGHQQMMTDAMKPLGIQNWQMTAVPPMHEAGGRLFVDVAARLASPAVRAATISALGTSDPLLGDALETVVAREGFMPPPPADAPAPPVPPGVRLDSAASDELPGAPDPSIVPELIARSQAALAELERALDHARGPVVFDLIRADHVKRKADLQDHPNIHAVMAGMDATWWLNDHLEAWLGETNAADTITQSAPGNITSEMGLALLDVADAIRPHGDVVAFLARVAEAAPGSAAADEFLERLPVLPGGQEARDAIEQFLAKYGMRCIGEIDITRPRWSEQPSALIPLILGNVRNFAPGAGQERFERGHREAEAKADELIARLRALPDDGERKAEQTATMIERLRTFIGYREYPKYDIVSRHWIYKRALLREIDELVRRGALSEPGDAYFLTFDELEEAVRTGVADAELIARRRAVHAANERLSPPRLLTSEGEVLNGRYSRDDVPEGALVGLAVSRGTVEGRARVVRDVGAADLAPGDILVTTFTDPSWSPVFPAAAGLVTEVGGLMTHGAVIAREYGLPAVVGVDGATTLIADGQRIRVHGTDGYVEIVDED